MENIKNDLVLYLSEKEGYKQLLETYIDYVEANLNNPTKSFYDFIYPATNKQSFERKFTHENWSSIEFIKSVANDFNINLDVRFESPFILDQSILNSTDYLSLNAIKKCIYTINSYETDKELSMFLDIFYNQIKPMGIECVLRLKN